MASWHIIEQTDRTWTVAEGRAVLVRHAAGMTQKQAMAWIMRATPEAVVQIRALRF